MSPNVAGWVAELRSRATAHGPASTADRAAAALRALIADGHLPPGTQVPEQVVADALQLSRNTLREAFRLLAGEQLLEHKVNRGVFVCQLDRADIVDIYATRTFLECAALRSADGPSEAQLATLDTAVAEARRARDAGEGTAMGSADLAFHQAVMALAGSSRLDAFITSLFAQLRLAFHVMADPHAFHAAYVERNADILQLLRDGDQAAASATMHAYLHDACEQILTALPEDPSD
ncbi:MAG: FCD domain-containing protein [Streptosporangiales bacterium]|nr:FCD domain-containing protein [Streptosporangiales bacterium]